MDRLHRFASFASSRSNSSDPGPQGAQEDASMRIPTQPFGQVRAEAMKEFKTKLQEVINLGSVSV